MIQLLFLAAASVVCAHPSPDLLGVSYLGDLYAIDSDTGEVDLIADSGSVAMTNSLARLPDGSLITASKSELLSVGSEGLSTIAPLPFEGMSIRGLEWAPELDALLATVTVDGVLGPSSIYSVDVRTGDATFLNATDAHLQSLARSPDGTYYSWDAVGTLDGIMGTGLVTLDPFTGEVTDASPVVSHWNLVVQSITFLPTGEAIGVSASGGWNALHAIDLQSGLADEIAEIEGNIALRGIEVIPAPPVGVGLAVGIGLVVRRRRRHCAIGGQVVASPSG